MKRVKRPVGKRMGERGEREGYKLEEVLEKNELRRENKEGWAGAVNKEGWAGAVKNNFLLLQR